jgi:hypothetical protein
MIVRDQKEHFVLIQQHDHALVSGRLAAHWGRQDFPHLEKPDGALVLAARLHDIGWRELDAAPEWNPAEDRPYSFVDEPLDRKLAHYRKGLDHVMKEDVYAALLCSMHYASFFPPERLQALGPDAETFLNAERVRQAAIRERLQQAGRSEEWARRQSDLILLKLWDDMSLYVCLNEPGASKAAEHPWYREGFRPIRSSPAPDGSAGEGEALRIQARWLDPTTVTLNPFPLTGPLEIRLEFTRLSKSRIQQTGYAASYEAAPRLQQRVFFVSASDIAPQRFPDDGRQA